MNKKQSWNIIALFLVVLFGMSLASLMKPDDPFSENENRSLASMPSLTAESLLAGDFTEGYENYITDQFIFRDKWIGLKTRLERALLRQDINDVYFAQDGYLIEKHSGIFDTELAENNITELAAFFEKLTQNYGSTHLTAIIAPNAMNILSDKLPKYASPDDEDAYLLKIRETLPAGVYFDTAALLREHPDEELYYKTDHHWKTLAAFYTFKSWCAKKGFGIVSMSDYNISTVTDEFYGTISSKVAVPVQPDTIEKFVNRNGTEYLLTYNDSDDLRSTVYQKNKLEIRDKYAYFYGGNYGLVHADTSVRTGRKLLVIKDSYAHCFVPFTYDYFDEVDMIDLRYFNQSLSERMEKEQYTDILFLCNAAGFAEDVSMAKLNM